MFLTCAVLFGVLIPLAAFEIECGTWPGCINANVTFDVVALDGSRSTFTLHFLDGSTGATIADALVACLDSDSVKVQKVSGTAVHLSRVKNLSPILFMTAKSKQWAPTVRRVDRK